MGKEKTKFPIVVELKPVLNNIKRLNILIEYMNEFGDWNEFEHWLNTVKRLELSQLGMEDK